MRIAYLLAGLVLLAWGASLAGPFHFDDYNLFVDPLITSARGWLLVWRPIQTRPLSQFTFWLSYMTAGATPWAFHIWNVLLHAGSSVLVWRTLRKVLAERAAVIAAVVFAVHPMQAEVVNYVFARSAALSPFLCLLSLWLWLRDRLWAAVAVFGVALLAKEDCVAFPLFIGLLDWWRGKRQWRPVGAMLALAVALGARVLIATKFVPQGGGGFASVVSPLEYFTAQGVVIWRYLRLLVLPWGFTVDPEIQVLLPWVAWLGVALVVFLAWRWRDSGGIWILGALLLLAPSSSIFPADDLAADRRLYLPMIGFAAFAGIVAQRWKTPLLMGLAGVLLVLSAMRTQVWLSERTLWQEARELAPDKVRPRIQLARALEPVAGLALLDDAATRFPDDFDIPTERGRLLMTLGRPAEALGAFGRALALKPASAMAFNNRGVALAALGQAEAARADFERSLRADSCFSDAADNLRRLGFAAPDGLQHCLAPLAKAEDRR